MGTVSSCENHTVQHFSCVQEEGQSTQANRLERESHLPFYNYKRVPDYTYQVVPYYTYQVANLRANKTAGRFWPRS